MQFFQLGMIINVLVSSFGFILIPMLWLYDHYNCEFFQGGDICILGYEICAVSNIETKHIVLHCIER